jgi:hypothetical protein
VRHSIQNSGPKFVSKRQVRTQSKKKTIVPFGDAIMMRDMRDCFLMCNTLVCIPLCYNARLILFGPIYPVNFGRISLLHGPMSQHLAGGCSHVPIFGQSSDGGESSFGVSKCTCMFAPPGLWTRLLFCRLDQCSRNSYVDDSSCLLVMLCVAKDETSVDIMCRGFVAISCGKFDYDKSGWRED